MTRLQRRRGIGLAVLSVSLQRWVSWHRRAMTETTAEPGTSRWHAHSHYVTCSQQVDTTVSKLCLNCLKNKQTVLWIWAGGAPGGGKECCWPQHPLAGFPTTRENLATAVGPNATRPTKPQQGFPGGAVVENPPANAGDTGSSPGLGGSHMPRSN